MASQYVGIKPKFLFFFKPKFLTRTCDAQNHRALLNSSSQPLPFSSVLTLLHPHWASFCSWLCHAPAWGPLHRTRTILLISVLLLPTQESGFISNICPQRSLFWSPGVKCSLSQDGFMVIMALTTFWDWPFSLFVYLFITCCLTRIKLFENRDLFCCKCHSISSVHNSTLCILTNYIVCELINK